MRRWALFAIAISLASASDAATWQQVATTDDGSVFQIDRDSVVRDGQFASVWVQVDHSKRPGNQVRSLKQRMKFDCPAQTVFLASTIRYAADGSVLSSFADVETSFGYEPVVPETAGEAVMKAVCG